MKINLSCRENNLKVELFLIVERVVKMVERCNQMMG